MGNGLRYSPVALPNSALQLLLDGAFDGRHGGAGFETLDDLAVSVDEEFREVPFDVGRLLALQPYIKWRGVGSVDINLGKLRERDMVGAGTEIMNVVVGTRRLTAELVAREVEDDEPLILVGFVDALKVSVLRGVAALCGGVDHQQYLAAILR